MAADYLGESYSSTFAQLEDKVKVTENLLV